MVSKQKNRNKVSGEGSAADLPEVGSDVVVDLASASDDTNQASSPKKKKTVERDSNKNHGRYGASDYWGAVTVTYQHETLKRGDYCPLCLDYDTRSKLQLMDPGVVILLKGNPLITARKHVFEKLRCVICNAIYNAPTPPEVKVSNKYDVTCYTALAMARYYTGFPSKRIETVQAAQGVPLADATQWDKLSALYESVVVHVYGALEGDSANGELSYYDDTPNQILDEKKRYEMIGGRKGVYTTAVVTMSACKEITLFYTSQRYAAENMSALLTLRDSEDDLILMRDASPNNNIKQLDENMLSRFIFCFCLVHGRRKFYDIAGNFKGDCEFILKLIGRVYRHEAHCKKNKFGPEKRLTYHQEHSAALMASLKQWLINKWCYQLIEKNSGFGDAIRYCLDHWGGLTRFLSIAGAPIDNSLCERSIKIAIWHRKNSLFFKTTRGAMVGDAMMSVIHTAVRNGVNPYDYLNQLQSHADAVRASPELWLPWNYQGNFDTQKKAA